MNAICLPMFNFCCLTFSTLVIQQFKRKTKEKFQVNVCLYTKVDSEKQKTTRHCVGIQKISSFKFFSAFHCTESANELRSSMIMHMYAHYTLHTPIGKSLERWIRKKLFFIFEKICNAHKFIFVRALSLQTLKRKTSKSISKDSENNEKKKTQQSAKIQNTV